MSTRVQATRKGIKDMGRLAKEDEAKRFANQKLTAEARRIFLEERERQRQQDEESDSSYRDEHHRHGPAHLPESSTVCSRDSSVEPRSFSMLNPNSYEPRELRRQLHQLEERYKEVMLVNAQLDGDKQLLSYTVDSLKDKLENLTESNIRNQKFATSRKKECAYQRMQISELTHQLELARRQIEMRDELLTERGFVLIDTNYVNPQPSKTPISPQKREPDLSSSTTLTLQNGTSPTFEKNVEHFPALHTNTLAVLSKETAENLASIPGSNIESKFIHLLTQYQESAERIDRLNRDLNEERRRNDSAQKLNTQSLYKGGDADTLRQNMQAARSQATDFKFRWEQANQKITGLEGDIIRLEGQVKRYKTIADNCEQEEEQLKQDRRKFQRELREAQISIAELKSDNFSLQRKIDKLSRVPTISNSRSGSSFGSLRDS